MSGFRKPYTVVRRSGIQHNAATGYFSDGTPADIPITASVQPAPGDVRKNVPEGYDTDSTFVLFTSTELITATEGGDTQDQITLFGQVYDVIQVDKWQNDVISHYRCVVARPKQATGA